MEWLLWNCMEFFYGIPWKMSKSFMENIDGEISMETGFLILHEIPWQPFPWNSMENVLILHGEISWNSIEIDVLILHGIPWKFFTRVELAVSVGS